MEAPIPLAARPGVDHTWSYWSALKTIQMIMRSVSRRDWHGTENLPPPGSGAVVCANHISYADPFAVAHMLHENGHHPFFLAKDTLFSIPVLGPWLRASGQVPVYRGTGRAADAFRDAVAAVQSGKTMVVMPESTITKDPDLWPMRGKTGAARIALATDRAVIPLAQWGAQELIPRGTRKLQPFPRKTMHMRLGPPVALDDLRDRSIDRDLLNEATLRIMDAITTQLEFVRGETAPAERYDPLLGRRAPRHHPEQDGAV